jgi:predicted RNase H-like nuclease
MDRTRRGWVVASAAGRVELVRTAAGLVLGEEDLVAVDIPIGLPIDAIGRRCEPEARRLLGARRSSVFPALPRRLYEAPYDEAARALARETWGRAHSAQAWSLGSAIVEVDRVRDRRWFETHPELAFAARNGGNPLPPKRTAAGVSARLAILTGAGIDPDLGVPVPIDDVLDALVCALVARSIAAGTARRIPADPAPGEGVIWY